MKGENYRSLRSRLRVPLPIRVPLPSRDHRERLCESRRPWLVALLPISLALGLPARAQNRYELGVMAAGSGYRSADVRSGPTTGAVGFEPGPGVGALLGQTMGNHFGGEIRYVFSRNTMKLSSGGTNVTFTARSHAMHYDVLFYASGREARVRPYLAAGGGLKVYEGTGTERAFQPLSNLALLTQTRESLPAGDFGGGVKFRLTDHALLRIEFRDYITRTPKTFTESPGARISGILHQWLPAAGVGWTF